VRESTIRPSLLVASKQVPVMRTLYIRHRPDEVAARLEKLADKAELLNALPSLPIERDSILEALTESRAGR